MYDLNLPLEIPVVKDFAQERTVRFVLDRCQDGRIGDARVIQEFFLSISREVYNVKIKLLSPFLHMHATGIFLRAISQGWKVILFEDPQYLSLMMQWTVKCIQYISSVIKLHVIRCAMHRHPFCRIAQK